MKKILVFTTIALATAFGSSRAFAHAFLTTALPKVGSTVSTSPQIVLNFTEQLEPVFFQCGGERSRWRKDRFRPRADIGQADDRACREAFDAGKIPRRLACDGDRHAQNSGRLRLHAQALTRSRRAF
jgi:hypothetical protein